MYEEGLAKFMIYAVDVGSTIPNRNGVAFAWCGVDDSGHETCGGICPEELVKDIASKIESGESVSLGVEAPLFIPVPNDKSRLSRGRENEKDRSWSAPAGGYVAALAVHQCAWLLRELHGSCFRHCTITADPIDWFNRAKKPPVIFCWEAFVSGPAHGGHAEDARTAAMYFFENQNKLQSAVTAENPLSLFGAAVLWSGWSEDLRWLKQQMVVLRPQRVWMPG